MVKIKDVCKTISVLHLAFNLNISAAIPVTPEITSSNSSEGAKSIKVESSTSTDFVSEQQDSSPKRFKFSKEEIESVSVTYHKSLLNAFPVMHIKYAAYLVTEFTTSATFDLQWNEFLFKTKKSINIQRVPKAGTKWNLPENIDSERERLTNHIYDHYLNEQLDFLILTIPDVDPMFLEEEVKNSEGRNEFLKNSKMMDFYSYSPKKKYFMNCYSYLL